MSADHLVAVVLAVLAAVLFGLAAVRQHGAVHATMSTGQHGGGLGVAAAWRLVRDPTWLLGALQAAAAAGSHVVALALAPITLVQPIGVLAVPVTVLGSAAAAHRSPGRRPLLGAALGVGGVAALTVVLLGPAAQPVQLPSWGLLLGVVLGIVAGAAVVVRSQQSWPPAARCLLLSVTAAVLFGLNAILLRTIGHLVATGGLAAHLPLLWTALAGMALALPLGLWSMQTAYTAGSPQVVICCLTLVDPITAVVGGFLLLHDGVALSALSWVGAFACTAVAAVGVVLLSSDQAVTPPRAVEDPEANSR